MNSIASSEGDSSIEEWDSSWVVVPKVESVDGNTDEKEQVQAVDFEPEPQELLSTPSTAIEVQGETTEVTTMAGNFFRTIWNMVTFGSQVVKEEENITSNIGEDSQNINVLDCPSEVVTFENPIYNQYQSQGENEDPEVYQSRDVDSVASEVISEAKDFIIQDSGTFLQSEVEELDFWAFDKEGCVPTLNEVEGSEEDADFVLDPYLDYGCKNRGIPLYDLLIADEDEFYDDYESAKALDQTKTENEEVSEAQTQEKEATNIDKGQSRTEIEGSEADLEGAENLNGETEAFKDEDNPATATSDAEEECIELSENSSYRYKEYSDYSIYPDFCPSEPLNFTKHFAEDKLKKLRISCYGKQEPKPAHLSESDSDSETEEVNVETSDNECNYELEQESTEPFEAELQTEQEIPEISGAQTPAEVDNVETSETESEVNHSGSTDEDSDVSEPDPKLLLGPQTIWPDYEYYERAALRISSQIKMKVLARLREIARKRRQLQTPISINQDEDSDGSEAESGPKDVMYSKTSTGEDSDGSEAESGPKDAMGSETSTGEDSDGSEAESGPKDVMCSKTSTGEDSDGSEAESGPKDVMCSKTSTGEDSDGSEAESGPKDAMGSETSEGHNKFQTDFKEKACKSQFNTEVEGIEKFEDELEVEDEDVETSVTESKTGETSAETFTEQRKLKPEETKNLSTQIQSDATDSESINDSESDSELNLEPQPEWTDSEYCEGPGERVKDKESVNYRLLRKGLMWYVRKRELNLEQTRRSINQDEDSDSSEAEDELDPKDTMCTETSESQDKFQADLKDKIGKTQGETEDFSD